MKELFAVSKMGLAKILARRGGPAFALLELVQNALDEASTRIDVTLEPIAGTRRYRVTVTDDSPEGFADLSHAWTLFAESKKRETQRGRFNLGEKLVIAICSRALISTTTGTVEFTDAGRRHLRRKTEAGSVFEGEIKMTQREAAEAERILWTIIPPEDKKLFFNGELIPPREPVRTFEVTLPTERADDEGFLRPTRRKTQVSLYHPKPDETVMLYELGLPVVATGDQFHVDIAQRVPLNMDRDNVTPAYLREVRTAVLNNAHDLIAGDDAAETWVDHALEDPDVSDEAVVQVLTERYGPLRVAYDPSDPEANKLAMSEGYCVPLSTKCLTRDGWKTPDRLGDHDETLGYNPQTGRSEWTPILAVHQFPRQPTVRVSSGSWAAVCTKNHRWLVQGRLNKGTRQDRLIPLNELPSSVPICLAAPACGGGSDLSPQEAALIAWLACDGWVNHWSETKSAYIYQSKPAGVAALESVLAGIPSGLSTRTRPNTNFPSRQYSISLPFLREVLKRAKIVELGWESFVLSLSTESRNAFVQACLDAEGHKNNIGTTRVFSQTPGEFNDSVRLAIYLEGWRPGNQLVTTSVQSTALCIPRVWTGHDSLKVETASRLKVWCPETALGTWTALTDEGHIMLTGNTVISGRSFNKQQWSNIRRVGAAQPAGQVTPSPKPYSDDPDAPVRKQLEEKDWTDGIRRIVSLTVALADELLHVRLQVMIVNDPLARNFSATYGGQGKSGAVFEYNLRTLGYRFFEKQPDDEELLGLIIHEFGHEMSGDHLSSVYHKALCTLGARLARLLRRHPNFFSRFEAPVRDRVKEAIR